MGQRDTTQVLDMESEVPQAVNKVGVHIIYGANEEPFLEAALQSVEWADYVCAVNTAPEDGHAAQNEATVRRVVPREKLRHDGVMFKLGEFDFGVARNRCLALADPGDYVLILDSDDVHYPVFEHYCRQAIADGYDCVAAHFWHLIGYKDLWGQEPHREILFTRDGASFTKSVHEGLDHPRRRTLVLPGEYHYVHYGYIKPPREIFKRWVLYSRIEGDPHHYDGRNPDDAIAGWLDNTHPFFRDHPPAVREVLQSYPTAPRSARALPEGTPRNIGLVLLTWNDAENLGPCLKTLALTRQPFELCVVDNGSTDGTMDLVREYMTEHEYANATIRPGLSLAQALNFGFKYFLGQHHGLVGNRDHYLDYIGWIHPDMVFERDTWLECLRHALDTHPDVVKVGAAELGGPIQEEPWPGNSQCFLIRKTALQKIGLFDERFLACGGYEDWDMNNRLVGCTPKEARPDMPVLSPPGKVMIWPGALIRHNAMGTRSQHDNVEAARRNAETYYRFWGTWNPAV